MKINVLFFTIAFFLFDSLCSQTPTDYLSKEFHKNRRTILRNKMPKNSVAFIVANPIRNRASDVDHVFHQHPNFYYLTGFREPNALLLLFSENQTDKNRDTYNEILYVPQKKATI